VDGKAKGEIPDRMRQAWKDACVRPLWESPTAHKLEGAGPQGHLWSWAEMRPLMLDVTNVRSPAAVERRVLSLVNPENRAVEDESTVRTISAALQVLLPGESARAHRHSMNALRFVLEGGGAYTIVDGKRCLMEEGDLVLTPGWCWHEHEHKGEGPIIWLDVLDVPFHNVIGTSAFEPGPARDLPQTVEDTAFGHASLLPDCVVGDWPHSPVFRYPFEAARSALAAMPRAPDGSRRLRYVNPLTGGPVMSLLDCSLIEVASDRPTRATRTNANAVVVIVEGRGETSIGTQRLDWHPKDVFTLPQGQWITHRAHGTAAQMFMTSDREIYRRLDLLKEEFGNPLTS
jgi:gentisate 1,2-dioxygenase